MAAPLIEFLAGIGFIVIAGFASLALFFGVVALLNRYDAIMLKRRNRRTRVR